MNVAFRDVATCKTAATFEGTGGWILMAWKQRGRRAVLCETSNKRDHDKQFLLQWRDANAPPCFQDNSLCGNQRGGGGSERGGVACLFRIRATRHFLRFNADAISEGFEFRCFQLAGTDRIRPRVREIGF